jgi:heme-degrading monooxygenase HmoA
MILTVLEARLDDGADEALQSAYATAIAAGDRPPGLVHSELIRDANDPRRWRIQKWWESRQALQELRSQGTPPAGILMFRSAGAEPSVSIFEVISELSRAAQS